MTNIVVWGGGDERGQCAVVGLCMYRPALQPMGADYTVNTGPLALLLHLMGGQKNMKRIKIIRLCYDMWYQLYNLSNLQLFNSNLFNYSFYSILDYITLYTVPKDFLKHEQCHFIA
jgi:hypothetical protein